MNARPEPTAEQEAWDPTIRRKLLMTEPKQDKDGNDIEGSERLVKCGENARRILENDRRICNRLGYDEARRCCVIRKELPWTVRRGVDWPEIEELYDGQPWLPMKDNDITEISAFLVTHYRLDLSITELRRWVDLACNGFRFHSIRLWLESLEWDGKPRIGDWLIRLAGAEDTELIRAYCPRILQAAVARAFEPGCKVDTMPILTSPEGVGKSSLWVDLAGKIEDRRLHCVFREHIASDNGTRVLHSAWIVDLDECSSLKGTSADYAKQWITTSEDRIVQKFKNEVEEWPRSSIFVASTNPADIIKDPAGARRYWVIEVTAIDREQIRMEREQLWAEAVRRYHSWDGVEGSPNHWALPKELWAKQAESVRPVLTELPYEDRIIEFLSSLENVASSWIATQDIIREIMAGSSGPPPRTIANDISNVMRRLGWNREKKIGKDKIERRGWQRPTLPTPTDTIADTGVSAKI